MAKALAVKSATTKPLVSFFTGIQGIAGYIGGGWYPGGSREGAPPFRSINSDSGQLITPQNSLQVNAVFACVRLISSVMASLPIELLQTDDKGDNVLLENSPIYRMLAASPNTDMTSMEFWEMMVAGVLLWGNAYAVKGTIAGRTVALTPLRPEYMTVFRDAAGVIRYAYARGLEMRIYESSEILHIKGFGVDGLVGLSIIGLARQTLGRTMASDEAASSMSLSGLSAGGFIQYPDAWLTKEQRDELREHIEGFVGSKNTGKVMVLEKGMTYSPIMMNSRDAQMLETRAWNFEEVCRWFGVPPALLGYMTKQSSWAASLENTILWCVKTTMLPLAVRLEQAVKRSIGFPSSQNMRFDMDNLERGDSAARAALYTSASQNGWKMRSEIRRDEGLPFVPGSDRLTVQSNLIPLDRIDEVGGVQDNSSVDKIGGDPKKGKA